MTTNKDDAKAVIEHSLRDYKCKVNSTICNLNQRQNNNMSI